MNHDRHNSKGRVSHQTNREEAGTTENNNFFVQDYDCNHQEQRKIHLGKLQFKHQIDFRIGGIQHDVPLTRTHNLLSDV